MDGVTHYYTYLGDKLVREAWGDNVMDFSYDEQGRPFAVTYNGVTYHYILNLQGDVIAIAGNSGGIWARYTYNAWGELIDVYAGKEIANLNPLRYRGYVYDSETGFYYLNSRYYDPDNARFLNADDISTLTASPSSLNDKNLYAYCDNNPVSRKDDEGEFWLSAVLTTALVGGVISGVADAAVQIATTGSWDWKQTAIASVSGAISSAASLIPGGPVLTTSISAVVNAGLGVATYAVNQAVKGEKITKKGIIKGAAIGCASGIVSGVIRCKSTGAMRESAVKTIAAGDKKVTNGILKNSTSMIRKGYKCWDSGLATLKRYAIRVGTNSGIGSSVGSIIGGIRR